MTEVYYVTIMIKEQQLSRWLAVAPFPVHMPLPNDANADDHVPK